MNDTPELTRKDPESLRQLTREQLVSIIVQQQARIEHLQQEIEQLKLQQKTNSQTSSKPPATDLIQKSEKPKQKNEAAEEGKRKPGGQPGHPGRTRKGFGRVDHYEVLRPQKCPDCGGEQFVDSPIAVQRQQVARLVERPIEVVEYQRQTCQCVQCGQRVSAPPAEQCCARTGSQYWLAGNTDVVRKPWAPILRKAARIDSRVRATGDWGW